MPSEIKYRDHLIYRCRETLAPDFEYHHKDYDGTEEDDRYGYHDTIQECEEAIDEWHDEQELKGEDDEC